MRYRDATMDDAERLMLWRNDKLTVAQFRSNRPVSRVEHEAWLRNRIRKEAPTFIAEDDDGVPIGTVHLDRMENKENAYETSVTVAPEARGKGYGAKILKMICEQYPTSFLYTEIKYDNQASMKSFGAALFVQIGSYGLWTQWRRMPLQ